MGDIEDEVETGANAKTIVYIVLVKVGKTNDGRDSFIEKAGFHCHPEAPTRVVGMTHLIELFEVAWSIVDEKLDFQTAWKRYFGKQIKKTTNTMPYVKPFPKS